MAVRTPVCNFGWKAPDFTLPSTEGEEISLSDVAGANGTLLMFICNHCPYVISALDRIVSEAREVQKLGIGVAAICSNDATTHPDDSFENMVQFARDAEFPFPYLHDEDQSVARAYEAACTPDFYGFNSGLGLQFRGRLDSAGRQPATMETKRDLFEAMTMIAQSGKGPETQIPSMGCSIKWK